MVRGHETVDLYAGFEGEPELDLLEQDASGRTLAELRLWMSRFADVVEALPPGRSGEWEGVPRHYRRNTGWYGVESWECDDPGLFLSQLEGLDPGPLDADARRTLEELVRLTRRCVERRHRLVFKYS